jgi:hypothetical protein
MARILLGQLGSNGDCLYATILARQIKKDVPDCHLTWAISSLCRPMIEHNPDVDEIWEVPVASRRDQQFTWQTFESEALRLLARHHFDRVYLSQIWPNNFQNFDGTVRPSVLRSYGSPITVPIRCVLSLTEQEIGRVEDFVRDHGIEKYRHRIILECSSKSGQSYVTPEFARRVAQLVREQQKDVCFILSSHLPVKTDEAAIVDASGISLRENAALTKHCTLFVGCGSGVTVTAISNAAQELPMIQILSGDTSVYASFAHDFEYWGLAADPIIELTEASEQRVADCILMACRSGHPEARTVFHEDIPVEFRLYFDLIDKHLLRAGRYIDTARSLRVTAERYGWRPEIVRFAQRNVCAFLKLDPSYAFPWVRREAQAFLDEIWSKEG